MESLWSKWFGSVAVGGRPSSKITERGTTQIATRVYHRKLLASFGRKGHGKAQLNMPCGLAVTKTGDIVVADTDNNRIQVFANDGQLKCQMARKGRHPEALNRPMCVALTRDDQEHIVVTDSVNASLKVFEQDGTFVTSFCEYGTFDFPYGIAITKDNYLVITDVCKHSVIVLYPSGRKSHQFGKYGEALTEFDHPYFVAVNDQTHIIVSDTGNTSVKIFDFGGQILQRFNLLDFRLFEEHFVLLQGLTVDPDENLIIVGNSSIYIAAKNGRFWEVILPYDGLHSPKCVAYSELGQLVVSQSGMDTRHEISVFRYRKEDFKSLAAIPASCVVSAAQNGHVCSSSKVNSVEESISMTQHEP